MSAYINFAITRRFGRGVVEKLVDQKAKVGIDSFVAVAGTKVRILCRIVGFPIFEVISYAAGLVDISFRKYFLITTIFHALPSVIIVPMLKDTDFTKPSNMGLWLGSLVVLGFTFLYLLRRILLNYDPQ